MKGLLLKDIINLKQQAKLYLLIVGIWLVVAVMNSDVGFFAGMMMIFTILIPITATAYDEKSHWDRYALTMPISRKDIVLSKYLLSFLCASCGALLSFVMDAVITGEIVGSLLTAGTSLLLGMIFVSVVLPIILKFGVEKGRVIMLIVVLVPTLLPMLLPRLGVSGLPEFDSGALLLILPPAALVVVAASICISIAIYGRKEF